ncbi:flagellar protein FlaG [Wukongibacter sp. M2B1]|uniref:flagellar protein FlaG n=1 Tax=Wukongibacter sp. M2B1 TaxID=3088895 RepID=UPI003D78EA57
MRIDSIKANRGCNGKNHNMDSGETTNKKKSDLPIELIERIRRDLKMDKTRLQFSVHEKTKQIMVKIIDNHTQQVVKEIPPEKILDMVASMVERAGLIVDKRI